jgi:hypothetical protein
MCHLKATKVFTDSKVQDKKIKKVYRKSVYPLHSLNKRELQRLDQLLKAYSSIEDKHIEKIKEIRLI